MPTNDAEKLAGTWISHDDMHPATNIANRRFWAPGDIEGIYNGYWPTRDGMRPDGLWWHFPSEQE